MTVEVIEPHGFCSGVRAAVEKARHALSVGAPVWCLHEIVHNGTVVGELRRQGMRFVDSLADVPEGGTVLFSAHGVPPTARAQAAARGLEVVDATCPFVARAHRQVRDFAMRGVPTAVIGDAAHVEVAGIVGEYSDVRGREAAMALKVVKTAEEVDRLPFPAGEPVGVVCQTTLSSDMVEPVLAALRHRYPRLVESPATETCTATHDRQAAVRAFVQRGNSSVTGLLVIGGAHSANAARLVEIALAAGVRTWRIDGPQELPEKDFSGLARIGLTAGASTPEHVVSATYAALTAR